MAASINEKKVDRRKYITYTIGALISISAAAGSFYLLKPEPNIVEPAIQSKEKTAKSTSTLLSLKTPVTTKNSILDFPYEGTKPSMIGKVRVDKDYEFKPSEINTIRPDLFNPGFFSAFDVLVHLNERELIELEYHFDESMNAHIIDSINGETDWWYDIYYSGGWREWNVFRPDHYPWKDETTLGFHKTSHKKLEDIYSVFKEEIARRENNKGKLIAPQVIIDSQNFHEEFRDIEVTPHNMRNDIFKEGVITALDVILSLADQGKITYELKWYESIGSARIVKSYWVEGINDDRAYGRCGYVYEAGSPKYMFFEGNHIHLPSDVRILDSPEYVEFFWLCI